MTNLTEDMRGALAGFFDAAGVNIIEPPILYPAGIFLDLIGEDIRRRLYIASAANGEKMALRPEFTILSCLHHLQTGVPDRAARYGYLGPVFRQRNDGRPGEFDQTGIEMIDPEGGVEFDAASVAQAYAMVSTLSARAPSVTIGDLGLFSALLSALDVPVIWKRRLEGAFGERALLDKLLIRLKGQRDENEDAAIGLARVLDGKDGDDVREAVKDMLAIAGVAAVGGRSINDIAERYMEKAQLAANAGWDEEKLALIDQFLSIQAPIAESLDSLVAFEQHHGRLLGKALDKFTARLEALRTALPQGAEIAFQADFGRRLDYYSGFNFELYFEGADRPVAGGGRYDRLLGLLAARLKGQSARATKHSEKAAVPAIGFSIWLDRLNKDEDVE